MYAIIENTQTRDVTHIPPMQWSKAPFADLAVGESFVVPAQDARDGLSLRSTACYYAKRLNARFSVRKAPNGSFRVYRVA